MDQPQLVMRKQSGSMVAVDSLRRVGSTGILLSPDFNFPGEECTTKLLNQNNLEDDDDHHRHRSKCQGWAGAL